MLKDVRISVKLVVVGALVIVIPLAAVTILAVQRSAAAITAIETEQLARGARLIAGTINGVFLEELKVASVQALDEQIVNAALATGQPADPPPESHSASKRSSESPTVGQLVQRATDRLVTLRKDKAVSESCEAIMCIGLNGVSFAASDPSYVGVNLSDRPYAKGALSGHANAGDAVISKVSGNPIVPVAAPIRSGDTVVGALVLVLDARFLNDLVVGEKIGKSGYAYVVDGTGLIIAHPVAANVFKTNLAQLDGTREFTKKMLAGESGVSTYVFQGVPKTAGFAPVKATGWSVGFTMPDVEYLAPAHRLRDLILLIACAAVIGAVLIFLAFARSITTPLAKGVEFAELVASGDLRRELSIEQKDEVGKLGTALNTMSRNLRDMVSTIQDSAVQVASTSEQITSSAQKLAEGAQSQASALEETSASVEELTASVSQVAEHAQSQAVAVEQGSSSMTQVHRSIENVSKSLVEIAALAGKSVEHALEGGRAVSEVVEGIALIAGSSEKIGGIVTVISDIADQTNLLALNASIEAARAGEHGRGFAVVAEEVSKLAERSSSSTKEIEGLIRESGKNVSSGVETAKGSQLAMEQIRVASQRVREMIGDLSETMTQQVAAMKELTGTFSSVSEMSQGISAATEEQATNAKQVAQAVETVNEVTQTAASTSEEMSAATEQLAGMALDLQKLTARFNIGDGSAADLHRGRDWQFTPDRLGACREGSHYLSERSSSLTA